MVLRRVHLAKCPLCGSDRIKRVQTDYTLRLGARTLRVPRLPRDECPNCGEKFFSYDATKRIEIARGTQRLPKSASRGMRVASSRH